jgi:hypothetical protein
MVGNSNSPEQPTASMRRGRQGAMSAQEELK